MSSRTRTRKVRTAAGVTAVQIPRARGRRGAQPFVVVVPEHPSLTRQAFGFVGRGLWMARHALAPTGIAVLALVVTGLLHLIAWWSALVLAPAALAPAVWFAVVQRSHPAQGSTLAWRLTLAVFATLALAWAALAAGFGPWAGPLPLLWLLTLIVAQTAWLIVRRTH
ncbi:hypothetical protein [Streptomyces sp. S.PB5]|uniref:hypothetical protein n=1 Tax=Streptomyces sp. S.PB5 TaxID=3020844 RepID=UPI0025B1D22F|nr:hypothetical protein [Streptomyces sp. S.PB5]MDN3024707.1 hypothetical protein [Streptomyces sp. S.PB5]